VILPYCLGKIAISSHNPKHRAFNFDNNFLLFNVYLIPRGYQCWLHCNINPIKDLSLMAVKGPGYVSFIVFPKANTVDFIAIRIL
jgi:hypothetical protein